MSPSRQSLTKVRDLDEKRRYGDAGAKAEWAKLVKEYDERKFTRTEADLQGDELKKLIEKLAEFLDELAKEKGLDPESTSDNTSPCMEEGPVDIDLERLAGLVFERLIFEARIERERAGWAA